MMKSLLSYAPFIPLAVGIAMCGMALCWPKGVKAKGGRL